MDNNDANNAVAQKVVETETTQPNSPQGKEPTTEVQTVNKPQAQADEFPTSIEEQRKAFQEMRQEIKQYKEELKTREQSESAFAAFKPQPSPIDSYVDPVSGEINLPAYSQSIRAEAAQAARDELDEYQARQKHPELFKDREAEKEIAALWFYEKAQGRPASISAIADQISKRFTKAVTKAEEQGAQKMLEEVGAKEQAGLDVSSQSGGAARQASAQADHEQLQVATRFGNADAIAARMRNIPWANK